MAILGRGIAPATTMLPVAAGIAAVLGVAATAPPESEHPDWLDGSAVTAPAATASLPAIAPPAGFGADVPPIRSLEPDEGVSGNEPDPEMFDRAGLEIWWQNYQARGAKH